MVFDDAVVNHDDLPGLVAMRMRVFLGRTSVGRPTCVADAVRTIERFQANAFFKISQLSFGTPQFEVMSFIYDRNSRRIVTAILQLPKSVDDQRHYLFISNVSNNSTHKNN